MMDKIRQSCNEFKADKKYLTVFLLYVILEFALGVEFC